ncbi:MAG: zf-HC2 domain-containing protein, partial [Clostridia bacterium]|nr:zf-HC2 domain-containing protein [Clostridia bacterium]
MNCKEVQENLSAYLDNILSAEEMILVQRHLDECNDCREELKILQETVEKLSSLEEKIPPISFRQELFKKLEQSTSK